mgnify:CR=1 FL=1
MDKLTEEKNDRNNKIEALTMLCNLNINKNQNYTTKQINQVIDHCLEGFNIAQNKIYLTIDERLLLFIEVRNYSIGK